MRLFPSVGVERFHWNEWINAALGILKGYDNWYVSRFEHSLPVIVTETAVDVSGAVMRFGYPLMNVEHDIWFWEGWPFFDSRICEFELQQLIVARDERIRPETCLEREVNEMKSKLDAVANSGIPLANLRYMQQLLKIGNRAGGKFCFENVKEKAVVTDIETWGNDWTLRAIKITFSNGKMEIIGRIADNNLGVFKLDYEGGELVSYLSISSNSHEGQRDHRVGAFRIKTNKDREYFPRITRDISSETMLEVGSGIILGAWGRKGLDVDALGFLMMRQISVDEQKYFHSKSENGELLSWATEMQQLRHVM